jgi:transcriptional regulator GlxA family with amidase domain
LAASRGQLGVEATARRVELGPRQLRDRVTAAVGYGPKLFGRVMRFRAALDQIEQTDIGLATVAIDAGYADQAHLTREVRALAGSTPGRLRADSLAADSFKTALVASRP